MNLLPRVRLTEITLSGDESDIADFRKIFFNVWLSFGRGEEKPGFSLTRIEGGHSYYNSSESDWGGGYSQGMKFGFRLQPDKPLKAIVGVVSTEKRLFQVFIMSKKIHVSCPEGSLDIMPPPPEQ